MEHLAGLDVSTEEIYMRVLDREGALTREGKTRSSPAAINDVPADAPPCKQVVFETGRMAPMLYHGLVAHGVPVRCVESRQAYPALTSLAGHKTDRNDARGLAHLARPGFCKSTPVKSLSAPAIRSLIAAREKLVGPRVTLDNRIRGLVAVFGVRLPHALSPAVDNAALNVGDGVPGLHAALRGLVAARDAILKAVAAIDADMKRMARTSTVCARLRTGPGVGPITALAFAAAIDDPGRFRRPRDVGASPGLVPRRYRSGEIDDTGSLSKRGDVGGRRLRHAVANVMLTRYAGRVKMKAWTQSSAQGPR